MAGIWFSSAFDNNIVFILEPSCIYIYVTDEINVNTGNPARVLAFRSVLTLLNKFAEQLLQFILFDHHGWGNKTKEEQSFEKEGQSVRTYQGGVWRVMKEN